MKRFFSICTLFFLPAILVAQVSFRALVPQGPAVAGESFRVQYVIENAETIQNFTAPSFAGFRIVNGPEIYYGQTSNSAFPASLKNMIYTLQADEPGRYHLKGAAALINGKTVRSNDLVINVISVDAAKRQASASDFQVETYAYLKPGEDPYEKIRKNLFLKVMLDKRNCFAGEPVVATFKLYSRLQSRSDIVKNPGFYGFAVHDMINLDDKMVAIENINGQLFDVHTIRKVQLYPLQAGVYTVDAMEVKNKVEFSRSIVHKKAEQEIIEGVFEEEEKEPEAGVEVFETMISTSPVSIKVKPLPAKNRPEEFNGATGRFSISAALENDQLSKNEDGYLLVHVKGQGNFNQLVAPVIQWPEGIEGFEPTVVDVLDKLQVPLKGSRTFRYPFVASRASEYTLPAITLSFFDPDSNKFRKTHSDEVRVTVNNKEKEIPVTTVTRKPTQSLEAVNRRTSLLAAGILVLLVVGILGYWLSQNKKPEPVVSTIPETKKIATADELLRPAYMLIPAADREFYGNLYQSVYAWLGERFLLQGTDMNKQALTAKLRVAGNDEADITRLYDLLAYCEAGMFTNATLELDRERYLLELKDLLEKLKA